MAKKSAVNRAVDNLEKALTKIEGSLIDAQEELSELYTALEEKGVEREAD
jgi:hypothetical protein